MPKKKYNTLAEVKEASKAHKRKWYSNKYLNDEVFRESERQRGKAHRDSVKQRYVTYTHLDESGLIYLGSGLIKRPFQFKRRTNNWKKHFSESNPPQVRIIAECATRLDALKLEQEFIDIIGLENLINERNAIAK